MLGLLSLLPLLSLILQVHSAVQPRRFYVDPVNLPNVALSVPPLAFRLGSGALISGYSFDIVNDTAKDDYSILRFLDFKVKESSNLQEWNKPKKPIEIYEFEACPFCRKVREAVSILDLDVLFYPCPRGGPTYRLRVMELGGKQQFPYMVDPNTGVAMYESDDIIAYLFKTYGVGEVPRLLRPGLLTTVSCGLSMALRSGKGRYFREAKKPKQHLTYWGYEGSPFCKVVREKLVELEIPHLQKSVPRGSAKRNELFKKTGRFQVPYIEDPNTNTNMFESYEIMKYLEQTYAVAPEL